MAYWRWLLGKYFCAISLTLFFRQITAIRFGARQRHRAIKETSMSKNTATYWNTLSADNVHQWQAIEGSDGMLEQATLAIDTVTGDYTRLTRFKAGADTTKFGGKSHDYPEEIYIISGRLYDVAFDLWLEAGHFASRPPGEIHGPFICEQDCLVLEVSFPSQSIAAT